MILPLTDTVRAGDVINCSADANPVAEVELRIQLSVRSPVRSSRGRGSTAWKVPSEASAGNVTLTCEASNKIGRRNLDATKVLLSK